MSKRWRKQKAGQQRGKVRKPHQVGAGSAAGAGGTMSLFRRGLKGVAGSRDDRAAKRGLSRVVDLLLWAAVAVAVVYFISQRLR